MITSRLRPMLAKDVTFQQFSGEVIVQPKLDGVRAFWDPETETLNTRNGRPIASCAHIIEDIYARGLQHIALDGEIYCNELPFERINGLVRKKQPEADTVKLHWHVFDVMSDNLAAKRAEWIQSLQATDAIRPVATLFAPQHKLEEYYQCFLDSDCEGLIIRDPKAYYQAGKSDALGRVKPVYDTEATLMGFEPTTSQANRDTFGALLLQLANGKRFKCAGLSAAQRRELWRSKPYGAQVTIKFKGLTANGLPREPRFKAIRTDISTGAVA